MALAWNDGFQGWVRIGIGMDGIFWVGSGCAASAGLQCYGDGDGEASGQSLRDEDAQAQTRRECVSEGEGGRDDKGGICV